MPFRHISSTNSTQIIQRIQIMAERNPAFRQCLLTNPKKTIADEFGVEIPDDHHIDIHEESINQTHLILPPASAYTAEDREAARVGSASLAYLKKTMFDPAPKKRTIQSKMDFNIDLQSVVQLRAAVKDSVAKGLEFIQTAIDNNGAWHCIRYNIADPTIPRHYERPPFVTAYCALALECCEQPTAKEIYAASQQYIEHTMEHPGYWRYYRHLPQDIDSTSTCSLLINNHPWIQFGRNIERMLANRDEQGLFMTWILETDEPDVVTEFRIESDPVVNANILALLGDCKVTKPIQSWLESLFNNGLIVDSSKWYPDPVAICYAVARAVARVRPLLDHLSPKIANQVLSTRDQNGNFDNVLQTAQAVSALDNVNELQRLNASQLIKTLLKFQHEDGSWPELLAFGDQKLEWGAIGQIGHASESMTTAFCIEALERLKKSIRINGT